MWGENNPAFLECKIKNTLLLYSRYFVHFESKSNNTYFLKLK